MLYLIYDNGSQSEDVILKELGNYKGIMQSDGYAPYRKLGDKDYPNITRIECTQHMKRKFLDCGKNNPDANELYSIINKLFHKDHEHTIGVNGWTVEDNLNIVWSIPHVSLKKLKNKMEEIEKREILLPESDISKTITYLRNEWNTLVGIFNYGDTKLENNTVERFNRYLSISRRNSLFFGNHKDAKRGAILYTIALSCKMQKIDLFKYLKDVINKTADGNLTHQLKNIGRYFLICGERISKEIEKGLMKK